MDDRELLEMAAKAAGLNICNTWLSDAGNAWSSIWLKTPAGGDTTRLWNPLGDDGQAFRLAIKLSITVMFMPEHDSVVAHASDDQFVEAQDDFGARRAIVRAAAEIGRSMP